VYKNERGAALYEDLDALGLGQNPQPRSPDSEIAGVTIGDNSPNSIFGALGLTTGDRIVAINGHEVSNPQDIGRLMREAGNTPIHIGYAEGESSGVLTTAALIKTL
jgi:membrane-associated protease RseP (regulator of RpoE activity)